MVAIYTIMGLAGGVCAYAVYRPLVAAWCCVVHLSLVTECSLHLLVLLAAWTVALWRHPDDPVWVSFGGHDPNRMCTISPNKVRECFPKQGARVCVHCMGGCARESCVGCHVCT